MKKDINIFMLLALLLVSFMGHPAPSYISCFKAAMFKIGKFLIPILEPFTEDEYTLTNSYHIYKDLNDFKLRASNLTLYGPNSFFRRFFGT